MLFNSIEFVLFLPIVFILYWFVTSKNLRAQNTLLLIASYFFYGWWDWRFLSLIFFSSIVDYTVGIRLSLSDKKQKRKAYLFLSILVNLGFLGYLKYFNFFIESFADAFVLFGYDIEPSSLSIILPVGISFYTFQTLSYSIDIYNNKITPTRNPITFLAYVSFFPQLVAGPIERASNLLPQFSSKRTFNYQKASDGLRQMLFGLFKKIVIADGCAPYVTEIFDNYMNLSGSTLLFGAILFAFQIYCDFSGYSDIAIGTARLFGFNLMRNFAFPYFSRDIAEFWRRWHISLSTWFRDYLYIPLGGSKGGSWNKIRNVFIIFIVSGFWHGANWTFIVWGAINACYFLPLLLLKRNRKNINSVSANSLLPSLKEIIQIATTFFLTVIAWIFFRSETISQAFNYIQIIFSKSLFVFPEISPLKVPLFILTLIVIEWIQRNKQHGLQIDIKKTSLPIRWIIYLVILFFTILRGGEPQNFLYFQF